MYVTREFALTMLCPASGKRRLNCVADSCMAWRRIILYRSFAREGREFHTAWTLTPQDEAVSVECGWCGMAGPCSMTTDLAPLGYDDTSVVGLTRVGEGKTVRSFSKKDKEILRARGEIPETHTGTRSPSGYYRFSSTGRKPKGK